MKIGIEVEGIINTEKVRVEIGSYHAGIPCGNYWNCQRDGSLSPSGRFKEERPVEFVSTTLKNKKHLNVAIKELRKILRIKKSQKLSKSIYFNKSCGCHIHISFRQYNFWNKSHPSIFIKTRKYFKDNLRKLNIPDNLKKVILLHYDRGSARVVGEKEMRDYNRSREFNFSSELDNKGIEWRSFNLYDVKSWKELKLLIKLAYKTARYLETQTKNWKDQEEDEILRPEPPLKKYRRVDIVKKERININEDIQLNKSTNVENIHDIRTIRIVENDSLEEREIPVPGCNCIDCENIRRRYGLPLIGN